MGKAKPPITFEEFEGMKGYHESKKIEDQIEELLQAHPISPANFLEWMKFARTLGTTMYIIIEEAKEHLPKNIKKGGE